MQLDLAYAQSTIRTTSNPNITFRLDDEFIEEFVDRTPDWGPLGLTVFKRTYARTLHSIPERYQQLARKHGLKVSEEWWLTIARVVEGTYRFQEQHCKSQILYWNPAKSQRSAQEMYRLIFDFKFLPPGRGLWMMGTDYIHERGGAALNNCAFTSTIDIDKDFSAPFTFLMDMSMLGVGVGGDCRGSGKVKIIMPVISCDYVHVVPDSREGWVELVKRILDAFVGKDTIPAEIDYTQLRGEGVPIKGFGGTSSGYEPLMELVRDLCSLLHKRAGSVITSEDIVDIFNMIGRCVVAGNIRRSAEIMFGEPEDSEFLHLKDPEVNAERLSKHGWASNNSVFATVGMGYSNVAALTAANGEPGYEWLGNAQAYSRMQGDPDWKDAAALGANPCSEQTLEPFELCCLVETFPAKHDTFEEYRKTLKFAYLYAKTVTLVPTHDKRTNRVMLRNRRIGASMSGIVQAMNKLGRRNFFGWCSKGYEYISDLDKIYSNWLCVPVSRKKTSVKPSGTTSLLVGATPGIHHPEAEHYWRVIRFSNTSPMVPILREAGYPCYDLHPKEPNTTAVYFPVKEENFSRAKRDVSMWEQCELAAQMQTYWADNQVSCTVTFKPEEAKDIKYLLELYEVRLKSISFLPVDTHGYEHAPYQEITKEEYEKACSKITPVKHFDTENEVVDKFCSGEACLL